MSKTVDNFEVIVGDLFATDAQVIGHGTNTHGLMGSGIAVLFKKKFPHMHETYKTICKVYGSSLFGKTQLVKLEENEVINDVQYVANVFSQDTPGADASYGAFILALENLFKQIKGVNSTAQQRGSDERIETVAIPRIGCGIGGLDWSVVQVIVGDYMRRMQPEYKLTIVIHPSDV